MKIKVQLSADGPITEMDEEQLERHETRFEDENEIATAVEYWIPGTYREGKIEGYLADRPHRSVHVQLKKWPVFASGAIGEVGG